MLPAALSGLTQTKIKMDKLKNWKIGDNNIVTTQESYGECRKGHICIDMPTHKSAAIVYRHEIEESDDECIKAANLIVAAPDMLNALCEVRQYMTAHIPEKVFDIVDNAVAKALGNLQPVS